MATEVKNRSRRRGHTTISAKHQITIPVDALREAGLQPGDLLHVTSDGRGKLLLRLEADELEKYFGVFKGVYPPGYLEELRSEWD